MSSLTVFVSGATGTLGRPVVRQLLAAGHRVRALAHGDAGIERIRRLGAEPVLGDLFDPSSLTTAMAGADAVLHLATRIPPATKSGKSNAWLENDRIRRDGTRNMVNAALEARVSALVYPSFSFVYPNSGDKWIDATTREPAQPPHPFVASTLDADAGCRRGRAFHRIWRTRRHAADGRLLWPEDHAYARDARDGATRLVAATRSKGRIRPEHLGG